MPSLHPNRNFSSVSRSLGTVSLAFSLSFAFPVLGQDWPQFRGPAGDGHVPAGTKALPLTWSDTANVAWKVPIVGHGWSSPIFVQGKLYLTTAVAKHGHEDNKAADRSLRALCLDAATGKTLWDVEVFAQDGAKTPKSIHDKNGHASPTPIFLDGKIYVHFGYQGIACLDAATGVKVWENRSFFFQPQHGNGGSPIIEDQKIIFSCDGPAEQFILALEIATGKEAWRFQRHSKARSRFAFSTPACFEINGQKQIITPGADVVNALNPSNGQEIWHVTYEGYSIVPKPVYGEGLVIVSTSFDTPDVLAIDPKGSGDITKKNVVWELGPTKRTPKTCSMILDGPLLYWVSDNGLLSCVETKTGDIKYNERIGGEFSASPILAGDRLYLQDEHGKTVVVKTGEKFEVLATNNLDAGKTYASHAVSTADGTLYIRGETDLFAIREKP